MIVNQVKTRQEALEELTRHGISIAEWARRNNFNPDNVRHVLRKDLPCRFGESHKIAVLLGIKDGVISEE